MTFFLEQFAKNHFERLEQEGAGTEPWERQTGEPDAAYGAFLVWRDSQPSARTQGRVAEATGATAGKVKAWRENFLWDRRVQAFDRWQDTVRLEARNKAQEELQKRHAALAKNHLQALAAPMGELARRIQAGTFSLENVPPAKLLQMVARSADVMDRLVSVERLANQMPASVDGLEVSGKDGGPMQVQVETYVDVIRSIFKADKTKEAEVREVFDVTPQVTDPKEKP